MEQSRRHKLRLENKVAIVTGAGSMEQRRLRLENKVAIVTGAGSSGPGVGTGKAAATLFAREGAKVLLVDRVSQRAEETLATILGGREERRRSSRRTLLGSRIAER